MVNKRKCQISHDLFWGFWRYIDLDQLNSLDDIIVTIKEELLVFLQENNLELLKNMANELSLHIHNETFGSILLSKPDDVIYVCDHESFTPLKL